MNDRLSLWLHLVSAHATILRGNLTFEELQALHQHEHDGPGTIRDHDRASRSYYLREIGKVLSEADPRFGSDF